MAMTTTGGFSSEQLLLEESVLIFPSFGLPEAVELGEIAMDMALDRALAVAIEVRIGDWVVFHVSLPGALPKNDSWIERKARVVLATEHSTMYERVKAEEEGIDWYTYYNRPEETHAIHGGAIPIRVSGSGLQGILLISGLPQVEDHLLGVEIMTEFLARKGETE
jgi:uncharacterized protein (UPF0303 family)